jgi:hypothetical protein
LFVVGGPRTGVQLWGLFSVIDVDREDFRELLHLKWADGDNEALQKTMSKVPVRPPDLLQYALVRLVQGFRKFLEDTPDARRETVTQSIHLAECPAKPV